MRKEEEGGSEGEGEGEGRNEGHTKFFQFSPHLTPLPLTWFKICSICFLMMIVILFISSSLLPSASSAKT